MKRSFREQFIEYRIKAKDTKCEPIAFNLGQSESTREKAKSEPNAEDVG